MGGLLPLAVTTDVIMTQYHVKTPATLPITKKQLRKAILRKEVTENQNQKNRQA
jgi:hypothetical protein